MENNTVTSEKFNKVITLTKEEFTHISVEAMAKVTAHPEGNEPEGLSLFETLVILKFTSELADQLFDTDPASED